MFNNIYTFWTYDVLEKKKNCYSVKLCANLQ